VIPSLRVTTARGSVHELSEGMTHVRRVGADGYPLRRDGEWVRCLSVRCERGEPMVLTLDGVAPEGETVRVTTEVVSVEGVERI
jgi:hypothetical protein